MPTRRDVLATFLGAAFAAVACKRREPEARYDGELLGADHLRGHRLREPELRARFAASDVATRRVKVAIVGAGPAGLSAAWRLIRAGLSGPDDVAVLELEDVPGGTSRAGESPVSRYPWGAHYVPVPSGEARALIALLDELGVVEGREPDGTPVIAEEVLCRAPEERLFFGGSWYEGLYLRAGASRDDLAQFRAFKRELLAFRRFRDAKGRRAFVIPLSRASDDDEVLALDRITMAAWMDARGFTSPRLRWLVDYACRDDYALGLDRASAWAGLFYFVSRMDERGESAELMTWSDGNGRLVRHLAQVAGARLRCGVTVCRVATAGPGAGTGVGQGAGVEILAVDASGRAERIAAERAIVATPRFVTRRIVPAVAAATASDPLAEQAERVAFDYGAWAVANLHLRGRPISNGVPFAWDNVLYESPSLGYVVATHQLGKDHGPTIWTWYYALTEEGPAAREKLLSATWKEWADVAFTDLSRAHADLGQHLSRIDVFRWGHAMTRPIVGAREALRRIDAVRPIGPIHFAHTDLSGVAIFEEAHDNGVRAAEEVLAALGVQVPSIR